MWKWARHKQRAILDESVGRDQGFQLITHLEWQKLNPPDHLRSIAGGKLRVYILLAQQLSLRIYSHLNTTYCSHRYAIHLDGLEWSFICVFLGTLTTRLLLLVTLVRLTTGTQPSLLDWTSVDSRLQQMKLKDLYKLSNRHSDTQSVCRLSVRAYRPQPRCNKRHYQC